MFIFSRAAQLRRGVGGSGSHGGGGRGGRPVIVKAEESGRSVGVDRIQIENGSQRHRVVTPPHVYKGKKRRGEKGKEKRPTISMGYDW